ncbi:MAG: P22 coat protein [Ruminococcaceae bacterium]|nr:P22 coat protein [Oscillospiraceae bacterium]
MAETNISVKQIARETLPRLIDNLVFPNLVYKDLSKALTAKQGDTVGVRKPVKLTASEFDEASGVTPTGYTGDTVDVKLDKIATVDMEISAIEAACDFDSLTRLFIEPAAAALAEKINRDGLALYRDIPAVAGTAGTTPDGLDDLAGAAFALDTMRVPTDARYAVWDPLTTSKLKQIPAVVNAEKCGSAKALRTGSIGRVFGMENYMSQAVYDHETELSSATASVKADVTDSAKVTVTVSAEGTVHRGDIITVNGATYTVKEDAVAADGEAELTVYPNITAKAKDTVAFTPSHKANLVFHPNAFAFVTRPLSTPAGVESYVTTYNGISLRVVRGYNMKYKKEVLSMDVLYAFKTIYPELAVRYMA